MSNIKFVMLDFDGTTANTTPSIIHCSEKVCQAEGYTLDRELLARNTGFTTEAAFEFVTGNSDPVFIARVSDMYRELYNTEGLDMITLFDGVLETMERLYSKGIKFAVTTNNVSEVIEAMTKRLGMDKYLDNIVCLDNVENGKPAPDIAIESMRRAGCTPEESIVVGDSTFDMGMGKNAGCRCCGVTYGSHDSQTLLGAGASWVIDDFRELEKIVLG
jgi:phosphoglycolate phosphatase